MEDNCDKVIINDLELIGAGGDGDVYKKGDIIYKFFRSHLSCRSSFFELNKQKRLWEALEKFKTTYRTSYPLIDRIRISRPIEASNENICLLDKRYSCFLQMEYLSGIPRRWFEEANVDLSRVDESIKELQLHLSFNGTSEGIKGVSPPPILINANNPPRGYFIAEEETGSFFLNFLRREKGLNWSDKVLKELIGYIMAWALDKVGISFIDVEFTLGYSDGKYYLNVLDFGKTFDTKIPGNNEYISERWSIKEFYDLQERDNPKATKKEYKQALEYALGLDIYCDVEDDKDCRKGWNQIFPG